MKIFKILATGFAIFWLATAVEAGCINSIPVTTPTGRFIVNVDGTVTDTSTGLMWMRCSLGQTWDGTTCTGTASQYQWGDALTQAQANTFANYTDWRLPNVKELVSIVERSCANPSINSVIFPATPTWYFWTNSPSVSGSGTDAYIVAFGQGNDSADAKTNVNLTFRYHVRLVRVAH